MTAPTLLSRLNTPKTEQRPWCPLADLIFSASLFRFSPRTIARFILADLTRHGVERGGRQAFGFLPRHVPLTPMLQVGIGHLLGRSLGLFVVHVMLLCFEANSSPGRWFERERSLGGLLTTCEGVEHNGMPADFPATRPLVSEGPKP